MSATRLIRRMDLAGLLKWFPEEGAPVVTVQDGRFVRTWTAGVRWETENSIWWSSDPDDTCIMGTNKKVLDLFCKVMANP